MTRAEFKVSIYRSALEKMLADPAMIAAMEVADNERPLKRKTDPNLSAERLLGKAEGYDDYPSRLKSLCEQPRFVDIDNPEVTDNEEEKEE